jgi:putative transposase
MAERNGSEGTGLAQAILLDDPDFLRGIVERALQAVLEGEMTAHLGAARYERGEGRTGYRNGHKPRSLTTRVGTLELRVPQDRDGTFSTDLFARYQRSEQALVTALMEMYLQGVSTRNVAAITEELCGTAFSKSHISALVGRLDPELKAWRERPLTAAYPYLVVDARYEHARVDGRVVTLAVLVVAGVRDDGRREVLAVEEADTESEATYHDLFRRLRDRGLRGVELVTSDDHRGLKAAIDRHFQGASWQRCQVHFARNLLGMVGAKHRARLGEDLRGIFAATAEGGGGGGGGGVGRGGGGKSVPPPPPPPAPGRPATPRSRPSWRRRSGTAWPATPSRRRTDRGSGRRTAWSDSIRNSNGGRGSCASSPTGRACCGW